jgi:hypothetical protein
MEPSNVALARLNDVGAMTARTQPEREVAVDVSMLVGGTTVLLKWLIGHLAVYAKSSEEDVVADARAFLEGE